ncbi:hypothetical protein QBC34DRAFT_453132 [Podospora aff. communis PSN243]|uniref:2,6-dihydroxypyridine 3-monooxygenase substrate binding domain-containing protein n=1 Tax=Podospora aff. communis PSN243 TaxID=3040156 RepID=A0AAV9G4N6_9PEZI|nr:hypothetical protein QBC34DRAFT_453132 [Podospora aff. communis PSN243]
MHFVIVGGSLGGLAAGIALKSLGHDTTILERNPTTLLHDQGAGIVAGGPALEFLRRYNRCKRQGIAIPSHLRQYLDKDGTIVHSTPASHNMSSWDLTYRIFRANYDGLASAYCDVPPPDPSQGRASHRHNSTVTAVTALPSGSGVLVTFHATTSPCLTSTLTADVLIAADGPSSTIRSLFLPHLKRTYTGYCALRGTVPEPALSPTTLSLLAGKFTFFHAPGIQILTYLIPGVHGSLTPGNRLMNFVYYTNFPASSAALDEILTDKHGNRHRVTLPPGMVSPQAWEKQKEIAVQKLPPQFAEVVCAAEKPFVQAVTDVISPDNEFLDGRVVLMGDALAGFRPHTVASTSQAAYDAMVYADYVAGKMGRGEWKGRTMGYARYVQKKGVAMGERSQFGGLGLGELVRDRDEMSRPVREEDFLEMGTQV